MLTDISSSACWLKSWPGMEKWQEKTNKVKIAAMERGMVATVEYSVLLCWVTSLTVATIDFGIVDTKVWYLAFVLDSGKEVPCPFTYAMLWSRTIC